MALLCGPVCGPGSELAVLFNSETGARRPRDSFEDLVCFACAGANGNSRPFAAGELEAVTIHDRGNRAVGVERPRPIEGTLDRG